MSFHQIFHGFLRCEKNSWFVPGTNNADIFNFAVEKVSLSKTSVLKLTWFIAKVLDFFNLRSSQCLRVNLHTSYAPAECSTHIRGCLCR